MAGTADTSRRRSRASAGAKVDPGRARRDHPRADPEAYGSRGAALARRRDQRRLHRRRDPPEKSLAGAVAREPIAAGEPIIKTKVVVPGDRGFLAAVLQPGMRAISVPVDATSGISGFVFPGDRVDILITLPVPQEGTNSTSGYQHKAAETVLRDVRVIGIDQRLDSKDGQAVLARTVTFEVTPKQSEVIAVAAELGKLSLSLRSLVPQKGDKSVIASIADSHNAPVSGDFTLDSEVSQLLPKPSASNQSGSESTVTILRGNGTTSVSHQPASRGS